MVRRPDQDLIGKVWCERFEILEFVGRGGMGNVFKARQLQIDREVALKVIHRKLTTDDKQVKRFEREARASSKLNHPNNIRVYDYGTGEDGRMFIAMEFLKGFTLADLVAREGALPPARVLPITRQLLKALAEAHQLGLVHRDLKPENIFLCEVYGETDFVKILDFGIAKSLTAAKEQADLTQTGFICGTPRYISPEQALGQPVDGRADLYAVAVLMYEMLTGRPPFLGENPISIVMKHVYDDAPPLTGMEKWGEEGQRLKDLVDCLLEKNPARRAASAEKVLEYLDRKLTITQLTAGRMKSGAAAPSAAGGAQLPSFDEATRDTGRGGAPVPPPLPGAPGLDASALDSSGREPVEATRMMQQLGDLRSFVEESDDHTATDTDDDPAEAEATQFLTTGASASRGFADFNASADEEASNSTKMMSLDDLAGQKEEFSRRHRPPTGRNTGLIRVSSGGRRRVHTDVVGRPDMTPPDLQAPRRRSGAPTWALVASGVAISVIILSVFALVMTKKTGEPAAPAPQVTTVPVAQARDEVAPERDSADDEELAEASKKKVTAKERSRVLAAKAAKAVPAPVAKAAPAPVAKAAPAPVAKAAPAPVAAAKPASSAASERAEVATPEPPTSVAAKASAVAAPGSAAAKPPAVAPPSGTVVAGTATASAGAGGGALPAAGARFDSGGVMATGGAGRLAGAELASLRAPAPAAAAGKTQTSPSPEVTAAKKQPPKATARPKQSTAVRPKKKKKKRKKKKKKGGFGVF